MKNVYLVFSANKSGEYFGYARMAGSINEEAATGLEWAPASRAAAIESASDLDLPRSIPTPATAVAPKGHIIDDSARGTLFWEAESSSLAVPQSPTSPDRSTTPIATDPSLISPVSATGASDLTPASPTDPSAAAQTQSFGTPFRIEWLSTQRLPFHRTRGLRNPWNAHREVKIARDGTELETSVGRRLVALFHRPMGPSPVNASPLAPSPGPSGGYGGAPGMPPGYLGAAPGFGANPAQMHRPFG